MKRLPFPENYMAQNKPATMTLIEEGGKPLTIKAEDIDAFDNYDDNEIFKIYLKDITFKARVDAGLIVHMYCSALNGMDVDARTYSMNSKFLPMPKENQTGVIVVPDSETSFMCFPASRMVAFHQKPDTYPEPELDADGNEIVPAEPPKPIIASKICTISKTTYNVTVTHDQIKALYDQAMLGSHGILWPEKAKNRENLPQPYRKKSVGTIALKAG